MNTVKAKALYLELVDGFDVFREQGRGRYDMTNYARNKAELVYY